jgi:hypothetical protein
MSKQRKEKTAEERQIEITSARIFGKHVSKEKAYVLLVITLLACAAPMLLGLRMWDQIPEIVPTGLLGPDGADDSLPRAVVVFGLPGLMCVLDLIAHVQLMLYQKRMELPPTHIRFMGRWGFPIISVLFCSGMVREAIGAEKVLPLAFVAPCILGLGLMILGSHMWDCPRESKIALRFSFIQTDDAWRVVHRFAGLLWLVVGLLVIVSAMLTDTIAFPTAVLVLLALMAPAAYGYLFAGKKAL